MGDHPDARLSFQGDACREVIEMAMQKTRFGNWPFAQAAMPLRRAWQRVRTLPPAVQLAAWVLLAVVFGGESLVLVALPAVIGLWLWETSRPLVLRILSGNRASGASRTNLWRWIRHLAEMVVAMYGGMLVYHMLVATALIRLGFGAVVSGDLGYAWMTLSMVVPMVALMRFQGHSWGMATEMAVGMSAPIVVCFALVRLGICPLIPFLNWLSATTVYTAAYYGMLLGMILEMVYRRGVYAAAQPATTFGQHVHSSRSETKRSLAMRAARELS
jgi:hypothetical protein